MKRITEAVLLSLLFLFFLSGCAHERALTYHNRGVEYYEEGSYLWAISNFNKAIQISPELPEAYHARAFAYYRTGRYSEALRDFRRYLEISPDAPDAEDVAVWIENITIELRQD